MFTSYFYLFNVPYQHYFDIFKRNFILFYFFVLSNTIRQCYCAIYVWYKFNIFWSR